MDKSEEYWVSTPEIETVSIIIDLLSPKQVYNIYSNINYILSSNVLSIGLPKTMLTFLVAPRIKSVATCLPSLASVHWYGCLDAWLQTPQDSSGPLRNQFSVDLA